ncbi:metal ABC transporter ATP-binding protein [Blochmannia endosymbiont of Camponotus (Colobopsis) obliquus]|uniref:metal ABC transporter ATP-binding protein n=1 Tax=Blochmannia endosymbiont of Camponotus (Colobopsis) obliquus TaxID=1505597 RepID=UPI00061A82E0|nr:ATP-binding cassette domain-containing protein [Blochmannia endosymbiont of Camponotus (Colobopsis) obliquus]AKC60222.1 ABC transporter family protein [Blochmannia endosymbiont of Camponotus (Colobopsis) obliquus]
MMKLNDVLIGYYGCAIGSLFHGRFKYGSMTAVVGNNGSGKTTLLKTLAGILSPISGTITFGFQGQPRIGYLAQSVKIDHQFPITVFDVVAMGCFPVIGLLKETDYFEQKIIWKSLAAVELTKIYHKNISSLSTGEFQRMLFARLLVQRAPLILLDEPFNNIDLQTSNLIMSAVNNLHHQGCTIIAVLHDNRLILENFPNVLLLDNICNVWGTSFKVLSMKKY